MITQDPIPLREAEAKDAVDAASAMRALASELNGHRSVKLVADDNVTVTVPGECLRLFAETLSLLADGIGVAVFPNHAELTTQQAADLLNVSRPYLVKLIEDGELPAHTVGTHRRLEVSDVLAYKKLADARSRQARDELAAMSQALGIDD